MLYQLKQQMVITEFVDQSTFIVPIWTGLSLTEVMICFASMTATANGFVAIWHLRAVGIILACSKLATEMRVLP